MPTRSRAAEWQEISDELQVVLAREALLQAARLIADQAALFALQFEQSVLQDHGAADALRLFSLLLRETSAECLPPVGRA